MLDSISIIFQQVKKWDKIPVVKEQKGNNSEQYDKHWINT